MQLKGIVRLRKKMENGILKYLKKIKFLKF